MAVRRLIVRLDRERHGYWLGDDFREGFADDSDLPEGDRRRIAGWARALAPDELTTDQRALLAPIDKPRTAAHKRAEELGRTIGLGWFS